MCGFERSVDRMGIKDSMVEEGGVKNKLKLMIKDLWEKIYWVSGLDGLEGFVLG